MLKECNILRRFTCRRNIFIMYGVTISVCFFIYMVSILVLSSVTSGDAILRTNNVRTLQTSYDDVTGTDNTDISSNLNSGIMTSGSSDLNQRKEQKNKWNYNDKQGSLFLDDEDIAHQKKKSRTRGLHIDNKNKTKRLPNAIIIGVKKAGTRALLEYLRLHPDVKAPGPEPHFFDKNYNKGLNWYRNLMPETSKGQITVEKTPSYFVTKGIPERVYRMSKKMKLIVVFRDPVTRAISDYAQLVSRNPNVKSFEEMVFVNNRTRIVDTSWTIVKIGVYAQHLARWLEYFPIRQFHFVSGENLIKNPASEMQRIQEFLGLEQYITAENFTFNQTKGFPCYKKETKTSGWHCLNEEKGRRHPGIDHSVKRRLEDFYRPFNIKLYSMTGQDFGWS
ncbi:heparan sulfate glucosamine 3-O-sulfotransferase 3B1-like [Ruditapes philippinarum]|uniref:heparan sulfate glucosamine 3-O-sulfotransferase 3B1-like n=1 Tax=Ruditapes philippinarum TaxID=129788 RepID=UPI00295A7CBE|nr:heparan sulfate glucosamine 3-O-sulfotransferase 3B1-like [Ruditapes philippinarum]